MLITLLLLTVRCELQQAASIGWEASQRGEVVDVSIAMEQIRLNLKSRYSE